MINTLTLIWIAAGVAIVMFLSIEYYAWRTNRRLITWYMRRAPKMIVLVIGLVVGALAGHFWWCPY